MPKKKFIDLWEGESGLSNDHLGELYDRIMSLDHTDIRRRTYESIISFPDKFDMTLYHSDGGWHNGKVMHECDTTHCMAGWAEFHACSDDAELLTLSRALGSEASDEIFGRLILGTRARGHFTDNNADGLKFAQKEYAKYR